MRLYTLGVKKSFSDNSGIGYIFAFFAFATLLSYFFYKKFIVETKGKTLEEIEKSWENMEKKKPSENN